MLDFFLVLYIVKVSSMIRLDARGQRRCSYETSFLYRKIKAGPATVPARKQRAQWPALRIQEVSFSIKLDAFKPSCGARMKFHENYCHF